VKKKHINMDRPLVSIITPSYNSEEYIAETIRSVQTQTYPYWELIIVDDGSTDNTTKILKHFTFSDSRISVIELSKNSGSAVARNIGIREAKGSFMTFIDSDDIWFTDFIESSILKIESTGVPFVYASYKRSDERLNFIYSDFIVPQRVTYTDILMSNSISCLTAFLDIKTLGKKYMPLVRKRQDMGLWLQYLKEIDFAIGILEPKAIYRIRKDSLSRNKWKLIGSQWYYYRTVEKLNLPKAVIYLVGWAYYGWQKYK